MNGTVRAVLAAAAIATVTIALLPVHLVAQWRGMALRKRTARLWHRAAARALGLRILVHGTPPAPGRPGVLIAANHVSWLDIVALGAVAEVSFIAKDEVRGWPFFGLLARLQDSVFIDRSVRSATGRQAATIGDRLARGDDLVLFAEGTTSCGNFVRPFKSALFGALGVGRRGDRRPMGQVVPAAIAYVGADGMPLGRFGRPLAAWPGDIAMAPHLWRVLREGRIDIAIAFGAPIGVDAATDRKALAATAEEQVRAMVSALLRGRAPASPTPQKTLERAP
ncbi:MULTISPECIES: lysophospholipid acyltransferase family protein [unclassified Roseitalea]|uniref:lysophospholipid acyltransferase family protein n=1 Tax=unclassified Roseitalea TaxID=2639107 RepID=UPI00273D5C85|nr:MULTISPECIES: lysophospholipid acyltransferase family protein [unclassified Roseitalea]